MWLQMGGHCEPEDATLAAAALREATEESGIAGLTLLPGGPVRLDRHRSRAVRLAPGRPVRGVAPAGRGGGDQRRVAGPALVRLRRGGGRGGRVGRTAAGSDPRGSDGLTGRERCKGRPPWRSPLTSCSAVPAQLQALLWFCPRAPLLAHAELGAAALPELSVLRRQQLAGLHQRVAAAR